MPRHLILRLPAGPGHALWSGRDFLGGPERVYLFASGEDLAAHLATVPGFAAHPVAADAPRAGGSAPAARVPDEGLSTRGTDVPGAGVGAVRAVAADDSEAETFDLVGIGRILAASLPTEARPQHRTPAGDWEPLPADSTGSLPPDALDGAVTMLRALFASRAWANPLLTPQRALAATSLVTEAADRAGRLDAGALGALAAEHRYRAVSWWWQVLEATEAIMDRRIGP
ncbi:hypothetical protein Lfu02_45840 [Longispora fulva]|uniref:Uncharacterized protein n=1 Tax=Longispora fulva TaxID=619741 RepID=A0A8J7KKD4_9ACTN|nr:hypothetical protein [Longispora fulva]MBG6137959.1 hypothetical protein [Longispora fulva]GIG60212.1 hypothetical protein Lfu02_45840 [Longispora fulva]